jgi:DHA1 family tetracycline resistance protein-like MFS transporter
MNAASGGGPRRAALAFIYVTVLLDMLAFGLAIPVLAFLYRELAGNDTARAASVSGWFGLAFAAMQLVFAPVLGSLSDRFGRRPVLVLSNLGLALDYALMAFAPSLAWLFVGRLIAGVTTASFSTASAYIADTAAPDKRAAAFGMLGALFSVGFILGPWVGGELGTIDLRLPFWVAGGLSLLNALYGCFVLPESLPREQRAAFAWKRANPVGALALLRGSPLLLGLAAVALLNNLGHDVNPHVFGFYAMDRYGFDEALVGRTLMAVGIGGVIVSGLLVGPLVRVLGERNALLLGLGSGALGFGLQAWAPSALWFWAGVPLINLWSINGPAMQSLMVSCVAPSAQGQLQGALQSLRGLCSLLTPVLFTQVFVLGTPLLAGAPYWLAAALVGGALLVAARVARPAADEHARPEADGSSA